MNVFDMGRKRPRRIGGSMLETVEYLTFNKGDANYLGELNSHSIDTWHEDDEIHKENNKWYQLLGILNYIDEKVFPKSYTTVVANQELEILNQSKLVLDIMYNEKWEEIKALEDNPDEDRMAERLNQQGELDEFSDEINYMEKGMKAKLRRFRQT